MCTVTGSVSCKLTAHIKEKVCTSSRCIKQAIAHCMHVDLHGSHKTSHSYSTCVMQCSILLYKLYKYSRMLQTWCEATLLGQLCCMPCCAVSGVLTDSDTDAGISARCIVDEHQDCAGPAETLLNAQKDISCHHSCPVLAYDDHDWQQNAKGPSQGMHESASQAIGKHACNEVTDSFDCSKADEEGRADCVRGFVIDVVGLYACHVSLTEVCRGIHGSNVAREDCQEEELKPMWPDSLAEQH